MYLVSDERFDQLVEEAITSLPDNFATAMENVAIVVDSTSPASSLAGLYEGVPLTHRDSYSYSGFLPDKITIFKNTICSYCHTADQVRNEVRIVVLHEIGHYFGIDDDRLEELGWG